MQVHVQGGTSKAHLEVLEGICSYKCTNVYVLYHTWGCCCVVVVYVGTHTHISFDLRIVCCDVHDKVRTHTHKEDLC